MKIKLIPVIEIFHKSDNIESPKSWPYWANQDEWAKYNKECLLANGFSEMKPYLKGSNLYPLFEISDKDLLLQIEYRTTGWELDEICPFDGGYILNVDGDDLLYPQCCSDLGDLNAWLELCNGKTDIYWEGHPWPSIEIENDSITFDMTSSLLEENFEPSPLKETFTIDRLYLKMAIDNLIAEMKKFVNRLNTINNKQRLGFERLDEILIGKITEL